MCQPQNENEKDMKSQFELRRVTIPEFSIAVDWAKAEGWNPGLQDIDAFFGADPDGFIMGFLDSRPISSISVVRYGKDYGFLGFYIVHPDFRARGYGLQTWNYGMRHLEGRTIGLDGVIAQQDNYARSGFEFAGRNIRYSGQPAHSADGELPHNVYPMQTEHLHPLMHYDKAIFGGPRETFLQHWLAESESLLRWSFVFMESGDILGYATIRQCYNGYKIGPLFAENATIAESLFQACLTKADPQTAVVLDVPERNVSAVKLAQAANLVPVFETARMYRGDAPDSSADSVYGVTTFELG